jgi:hypothetical protein
MQVFVAKADLALPVVPVYGSYPDVPLIDRAFLGSLYTPLILAGSVIVPKTVGGITTYNLASNWRSYATTLLNGEAQRRILEVFSEFMQRNANNDVNRSTLLYGANQTTWPADAQARLTEAQRGWNYVSALRTRSDSLATNLPNDPTADSNWPTVITPIYIPAV